MTINPRLIDTHCHLHFPAYDSDRDAVLSRMREKEIWGITIGTAMENSRKGIEFAEKRPDVWTTVGLHPSHTTNPHHDENEGAVEESSSDPDILREIASSSKKVVAIGESGLDFYRFDDVEDVEAAKEKQEESFRNHIDVAHELDLPLVIHCREALGRLAEMIQDAQSGKRKVKGVVHSFTGTWEEAKPLLDLGLYIAVNGIATFPLRKTPDSNEAIDRTIEHIPLDRLLLETDAPYLAPAPYRGKRNEPAYVEEVAKHVARVRGVSFDEVAAATTDNARNLFGI
jgi:TatD DNase family protein